MSRRHAEPIEVRRHGGEGHGDTPAQFLWRSRLYVVKDVLEHWFESGRWWVSAPAMALAAGADPSADSVGDSASAAPADPAAFGAAAASIDDADREFWRVEAGAGPARALGVYDLCFDWSRGDWQLVEVHD